LIFIGLHGVASKKMELFIITVATTSAPVHLRVHMNTASASYPQDQGSIIWIKNPLKLV
jgi:hypothetical protein